MTFQERLKESRKARNISIRRLCGDLKIGKSTYENWEIDVFPSRPELYRKLAEYLEVPLEYLLFGETKNTEWDEAIFHLRLFLEAFVRGEIKRIIGGECRKVPDILGQNRGALSFRNGFSES